MRLQCQTSLQREKFRGALWLAGHEITPMQIDLFYSFRSPYSYLLLPPLEAALARYDFSVAIRPVYPLAIRTPDFFTRTDRLFGPYLMRDTMRVAQMGGIPYAWPKPDPVVMDMATLSIPREQPYIHRLTRLGVVAARSGNGFAFVRKVAHLIWSGEVRDWHLGDHLARAAEAAGFDLAQMDEQVSADPAGLDAEIETNQKAQREAGHWGVPLMVFEGEPFFGQDRLEHLIWRMKQKGLRERA
jgi:2-hydroxychromene-2-carboxylate isomerase